MGRVSREYWWALVPALVLPFVASLLYFVILQNAAVARYTYTGIKVFLVVWPIVCTLWIFRSRLPRLELRAARHRRALPMGIITGLIIVGLAGVLMLTPAGKAIHDGSANIREKAEGLGILKHYVIFSIFLSIIHSFIEEYYWRWFVYGRLREVLSRGVAVAIASLAFASHHYVIVGQFFTWPWALLLGTAIAVGGAIWCRMMESQNTLAGVWLSHMIVDLGVMGIGYFVIMQSS